MANGIAEMVYSQVAALRMSIRLYTTHSLIDDAISGGRSMAAAINANAYVAYDGSTNQWRLWSVTGSAPENGTALLLVRPDGTVAPVECATTRQMFTKSTVADDTSAVEKVRFNRR
jgi:hypothetical protein